MLNFDLIIIAGKAAEITDRSLSGISVLKPLYWFFGKCMELLLSAFDGKYFLALIVFTILTRVVLFPLNISQQKKTAKTARLQPKIQKIQKKYANSKNPQDRQKMNEEMQAMYAREGHNPMNMGCGPMLFQMIFLMGIIGLIYYPILYVLDINISGADATKMAKIIGADGNYFQLQLLQNFDQYQDKLAKFFSQEQIEAILNYKNSMKLGSLDMTIIPKFSWDPIIIIPVLCLVTSLASSLLSTRIQKKNNPAMAQQGNQMLIMMIMMPFVSFFIAFRVSAAVGFYWIISNLVAVAQQLVMAKFFPPKKNIARTMIEGTIQRRAREESVKQTKK